MMLELPGRITCALFKDYPGAVDHAGSESLRIVSSMEAK